MTRPDAWTMANAISREQKAAKADAIATAALALNREMRFEEWTVAQVARRAGVAKGTVFLYYESKEALGLAVAQRLMGEWLDDLDGRLEAESPLTPAAAAQAVARSLESRVLRRAMGLIGQMEHGAGRASVERYRTWLLDRFDRTGRLLEGRLSFLRPGEGLRLLLLIQALAVGYHALAEPTPVVDAVLAEERFARLRMDFRRAVAESVWMQLEGLRASRPALNGAIR